MVRAIASHQYGPGSNPGVDAVGGLSLLLVPSLAFRAFLSWYTGFTSYSKTSISTFKFDWESDRRIPT